jgi:uncharacterized protein YecT (DUF1311 family)
MIKRSVAGTVFSVLVFLAAGTQTVLGQEAEDIKEVEGCLTTTGESAHGKLANCIGKLSNRCNIELGAGSAYNCIMREAEAWTFIAKRRLADLVGKSKPEVADSVRSTQAAWEKFREAQCDATGVFFYQYSGTASAEWGAQCWRDTAAERALLLDDWLMRAEDFE